MPNTFAVVSNIAAAPCPRCKHPTLHATVDGHSISFRNGHTLAPSPQKPRRPDASSSNNPRPRGTAVSRLQPTLDRNPHNSLPRRHPPSSPSPNRPPRPTRIESRRTTPTRQSPRTSRAE
jgi:hypothetical protein